MVLSHGPVIVNNRVVTQREKVVMKIVNEIMGVICSSSELTTY